MVSRGGLDRRSVGARGVLLRDVLGVVRMTDDEQRDALRSLLTAIEDDCRDVSNRPHRVQAAELAELAATIKLRVRRFAIHYARQTR